MVSMRVLCYLLIFFMLINIQASEAANSGGLEASTITHVAKATRDVIGNRKVLKHLNANVEANEKNSLEIESKETVRKRKNKKRVTKTVSLTADYNDPGHHPPRHN